TATVPMPGLSGVGPAMAATRNYIFSLNAEVMPKGIYAGTVNIGGVIDRSTGLRAMTSAGAELDPRYPILDPDHIADELWSLVTRRDRVEAILPQNPAA
ncbi:short-chain dehydrogenase, partial [Mesorhizobium sp. M1A.F.Ca.IN.022.05.2.1]